jgi:hypothetical protein
MQIEQVQQVKYDATTKDIYQNIISMNIIRINTTTYVKIRNSTEGITNKNNERQNAQNSLLAINLPPQKNIVFPS